MWDIYPERDVSKQMLTSRHTLTSSHFKRPSCGIYYKEIYACFMFLSPAYKETSVRWLVTPGPTTMATEWLVSPAIRHVPPAQVSPIYPVYSYCISHCVSSYRLIFSTLRTSLKCLFVCVSGTGVEACTKCAEGYLLEDWRCVPSCSSGYYLSEQTSDNGHVQKSCKRWVKPPSNTPNTSTSPVCEEGYYCNISPSFPL